MTVTSYYGKVKWAIHFATIIAGQWTIFGFFRSPVVFGSRYLQLRLQDIKVHHYLFALFLRYVVRWNDEST